MGRLTRSTSRCGPTFRKALTRQTSQTIKTTVMETATLLTSTKKQNSQATNTFSISHSAPRTWVKWTKIARFKALRAKCLRSGKTWTAPSMCQRPTATNGTEIHTLDSKASIASLLIISKVLQLLIKAISKRLRKDHLSRQKINIMPHVTHLDWKRPRRKQLSRAHTLM
jgi:hypothetical protein